MRLGDKIRGLYGLVSGNVFSSGFEQDIVEEEPQPTPPEPARKPKRPEVSQEEPEKEERGGIPKSSMERWHESQERKEPPKSSMDRYHESQERKAESDRMKEELARLERFQESLDTNQNESARPESDVATEPKEEDVNKVLRAEMDKVVESLQIQGLIISESPPGAGTYALRIVNGEQTWVAV